MVKIMEVKLNKDKVNKDRVNKVRVNKVVDHLDDAFIESFLLGIT